MTPVQVIKVLMTGETLTELLRETLLFKGWDITPTDNMTLIDVNPEYAFEKFTTLRTIELVFAVNLDKVEP